jgi:DNA-binding CsgD family transcriptional regulator
MWRAWALGRRGDLVEAEQELQPARDELLRWGFGEWVLDYVGAFLALVLVERGDLAGARRALPPAEPPADPEGLRYWLLAKLVLLVAEGRSDQAVEVADAFPSRCSFADNPAAAPWRSLKARALDLLGRHDEALRLAREELELAREWGAQAPLGHALRVLGTLERDARLGRLSEAVEVPDGSPSRLARAKALAAFGSALRRSRHPRDARAPLARALELADLCGAQGLAEHVRSELYATCARPRTSAVGGVESLTPSERRVATLAADGRSNREIAQTLFVTPKTVEVHLSNVYRKLAIRSRRELTSALSV